MNATAQMLTPKDVAEFGVPFGYTVDSYAPGEWIPLNTEDEIANDSMRRVAEYFHRGLNDHAIRVTPRGRFDTAGQTKTRAADAAAEVFWTNALEQQLASIIRTPKSTQLMVGPSPLIPRQSTLRPGQIAGVYNIETTTGQAAWVEPDGSRKLPQVGEASERKRYTAGWCGIGYGVGMIEMWQAAELGRPIEQMRANNARATLDRFVERVSLYGDAGHQMNGLIGNQQGYEVSVGDGDNFTDMIADPDDAQVVLQIMEKTFNVIGETYNGQITGGIAPMGDRRAFMRMRWTNLGLPAWPDFERMHPWLQNIRWVEHIESSPGGGGPAWTLWCADDNELWNETMDSPMIFGPWTDANNGLRSSWGLIRQIGGVILRRRERKVRFQFAA